MPVSNCRAPIADPKELSSCSITRGARWPPRPNGRGGIALRYRMQHWPETGYSITIVNREAFETGRALAALYATADMSHCHPHRVRGKMP